MTDSGRTELNAHARGHASVYQVGNGEIRVAYNTYYGAGVARPAPLELPQLRAWIDHALADYRNQRIDLPRRERHAHERDLTELSKILDGEENRQHKDAVRRLVVAGVVQYITLARAIELPLSEHAALDLVVFALWPVVRAPRLPAGWESHLAEMTSPRLASTVVEARNRGHSRHPVSCEAFTRVVAAKSYARGVLALLEDLADPREGGSVVTALALANHLPPPPTRNGPRAVLAWFVAGIATTSVAESEKLDQIITNFVNALWGWSIGRTDTLPNPSSHDDDDQPSPGARSAAPAHEDDGGFSDMLEEIVDSFFN